MKLQQMLSSVRLVALAAAAVGSSGAFAALSDLTITSFNVSASAGTLTWLPSEDYRTFNAQAADGGGLLAYDTANWEGSDAGPVSGVATTPATSATYGSQTTSLLSLNASALSSGTTPLSMANASFAIGLQSGAFTLSGPGIVTFTIGYTANLATSASAQELAYAIAGIDVGNYATGLDQASSISYLSSSISTGNGSFSGVLTVQVAMQDASDMGYYTLNGRTDASSIAAAVPEPETWAMLPAGLLVVGTLLARRRKATRSSEGC